MQVTASESKDRPFLTRLLFCILLAVIFYFLGFGIYYLNSFIQFIASSASEYIPVSAPVKTAGLTNQANILLLGSDNDQKFTGNPLTQTMMVIHIDYAKKEVDMFSIPRDLWVRMPDRQSYGKIDQAAEYEGIPSAIKVVEQTFGIPVDYYAWVGLYGFIQSIDALGGINLQIVHPVLDNSYPTDINNPNPNGYQRLDIQPGMQHLIGSEALQYVRSRHEDLLGDFGRTQRQRQLLLSIKDSLLHSKFSILKLPNIFASLNGQIKTDISNSFMLQLGIFFIAHKNIAIKQFTLSPPRYASVGTSTDGQNIVVAIATASSQLISDIFGASAGQITLNSLSAVQNIQP